MNTDKNHFHKRLRQLIDAYVHKVYDISKNFPKEELFGLTSQLKRAAVSVALNYVEGYARKRPAVLKNFLETAYGSLKESQYLIDFAAERGWVTKNDLINTQDLSNEIGAMLWSTISGVK